MKLFGTSLLVSVCNCLVSACVQQSKGYSVRTRSALASRNGLFYPLNRCHRARLLSSKLTLGVWPWLPVCNLSSLPLPSPHASQRPHLSNSPSPPLPNTLTVCGTQTNKNKRKMENMSCVRLELKFMYVFIYLCIF